MPTELIPIGFNGGGSSLICIGLSAEFKGKIYFWDCVEESSDDDYLDVGETPPPNLIWRNVHHVADSFEDFVARLFENE